MKHGRKSLWSLAAAAVLAACLTANPGTLDAQTLYASDYQNTPRIAYQGKLYTIVRGAVYEIQGPLMQFVQQYYDPNYYGKYYQPYGDVIYRVVDASTRFPVRYSMADSFENANTIRDIVTPARGFTSITLQSPLAPTVAQYVALRHDILLLGGNFLDNRIEPSSAQVHSGSRSLHAYAVAPNAYMNFNGYVSKASLESELMHFKQGDELWFSGWFYIAQGTPRGIVDFETSYVPEYPGLRILLDDTLHPRVELKWATKPTYMAVAGAALPVRKWVNLVLHAHLSDGADGRVELWMDGRQIISGVGPTLPVSDMLYDRLEIGITANEAGTAEVYVDDIIVDKQPLF